MRNYKKAAALSLLAAFLLVAIVVILRSTSPPGWGDLPFDQKQWKAGKTNHPDNIRGKMVRSLVRHEQFRGKTRAEVVELLGPPDGANHRINDDLFVPDAVAAEATEFDYTLGMYSGFRMDYDVLEIRFDDRGRVRKWEIAQW
jgi:hypothetical protein